MRSIITFLLLTLLLCGRAEEFTTGGIYIQLATQNSTCNLISSTTNILEKLEIGKTYRVESEVMEFNTKTNESVVLAFSTGLQVKINPESGFSIDSFNQSVINDKDPPSVLNSEYSITSLSLMSGEIDLICPNLNTNSQCILQTPLVNVNMAEGKLSIKSNPKYVILNAIEGRVSVVDAKNKKTVIEAGNLGLIIPYPGRKGEIMVTQKPISLEELQEITASLNELSGIQKNVLFVVIDGKVIGIRLK